MHNVIVIGDANVDIIVPYPRFLNKERTLVDYPTPELQGGGTSANTAVALAKLGVGVSFWGTVGEDQYGRYIKKDLKSEGVNIADMITEPELNTVGVFAFIDRYRMTSSDPYISNPYFFCSISQHLHLFPPAPLISREFTIR